MRMKILLPDKEVLLAKLYEVCPEIGRLGLYPLILGRGHRY